MKAKLFLKISVIFMLTVTVNSYAQRGGNPQERLKKTLEDYKTRLKLTDAQFEKIDTIMTVQMNEQMKLRERAGDDRESIRASMMELREKTNTKIEALLTDEQKVECKKIQEERAAQRGQGAGRGQ